jgi:putative transposase
VVTAAQVSDRQACRFVGVARSSHRYRRQRDDTALRAQLEQLATERPRWGYRRLHVLVRRTGAPVNHKRLYRVYRAAGLAVRRRRRKRVAVARRPLVAAPRPDERCSLDFVTDRFGADRRFRALAVVDDFTRECSALEVDTSLPGERVCRVLDRLGLERGVPGTLVTDNGPEFAGRAPDVWAYQHGVQLAFIQPGKPTQNAYVESFNGKLRDECLAQRWLQTLAEARLVLEHWRRDYNEQRPHSSLGDLTPSAFAGRWATLDPQPETRDSTIRTGTA